MPGPTGSRTSPPQSHPVSAALHISAGQSLGALHSTLADREISMNFTSQRTGACQRCGGRLIMDDNELYCLMCGFVDYGTGQVASDAAGFSDDDSSPIGDISSELSWDDAAA